jgi:glycosyltransferase involved in cell wall biosynthesis
LRVTVVTPSFNQGAFIERTIESVLSQRGDFELEYLVVDGGSTDGTLSILRSYEGRLRFVSERDSGQSAAINKGFGMASGDVLAWLNSDDTYMPGALHTVVRTLRDTRARWCFGECRVIDERDREIRRAISAYKSWISRRYSLRRLLAVGNFIPQPATFFRREILEQTGRLEESFHLAMDYDLWLRLARLEAPAFIPRPLANFRWHGRSKTGAGYHKVAWECFRIACRHARGFEHAALAQHLANYSAQMAVYKLLDLVRLARRSG